MNLSIEALGAFTSVGTDVPMTMASLLSQFQAFDDLEDEGSDGELVTGARTALAPKLRGIDRLGAMGLLALRECATALPGRQPLPLLVCAPDAGDLGGSPGALLDKLTADATLAIDRTQSRVISQGATGIVDALFAARALLERGAAPSCYVLGVDSLVTGQRVQGLLAAGQLIEGNNSNGFVPGEAAVALRVGKPGASKARGFISGVGSTVESRAAGVNVSYGEGLARAAEQALAEAKMQAAQLKGIAHDVSGIHSAFEEMLMARSRPPLNGNSEAEMFSAALSVGEVGTAAGPLNLAMLAFFIEQKVIDGPALCLFRSNGDARGAAVVMPATTGKA
jgi:3-oxoacyl-[acyl-carrier-protein] synthase I